MKEYRCKYLLNKFYEILREFKSDFKSDKVFTLKELKETRLQSLLKKYSFINNSNEKKIYWKKIDTKPDLS